MVNGTSGQYIKIPKEDYARLVNLDKQFGKFLRFIKQAQEVEEARKDIKKGQTKDQEEFFTELGL